MMATRAEVIEQLFIAKLAARIRDDEVGPWKRAFEELCAEREREQGVLTSYDKIPKRRVFLAVENPWHLAAYRFIFEQLACHVEGTRHFRTAAARIAPRYRKRDDPAMFDTIVFEQTQSEESLSQLRDFSYMIRDSDLAFRRLTNVVTRRVIIALIGQNENGKAAMENGADIFFHRPLIANMRHIRTLLLPQFMHTRRRCRLFMARPKFAEIKGLFQSAIVAAVPPPTAQNPVEYRVVSDDIDTEEISAWKAAVKARDREIHRLQHAFEQQSKRLRHLEAEHKECREKLTAYLAKDAGEADVLRKQLVSATSECDKLKERVEILDGAEKNRLERQKSIRDRSVADAEARVRKKIESLVSELEHERRKAHYLSQNTTRKIPSVNAEAQAGPGLPKNHMDLTKDKSVDCHIIAHHQIERLTHENREVSKALQHALGAQQQQQASSSASEKHQKQNRLLRVMLRLAAARHKTVLQQKQVTQLGALLSRFSLEAFRTAATSHATTKPEDVSSAHLACLNSVSVAVAALLRDALNDNDAPGLHSKGLEEAAHVPHASAVTQLTEFAELVERLVSALQHEKSAKDFVAFALSPMPLAKKAAQPVQPRPFGEKSK